MGAPAADSYKGRAYLVYGTLGIEIHDMDLPLDLLSSEQGVVFSGTADTGQAGAAVAGGKAASPFIAIGAPGTGQTEGKVYVFKKSDLTGKNTIDLSTSPLILSGAGNREGNLFGSGLIAADINNNGQDDLVILAPGDTSSGSIGQVYVVYDGYLNTGSSGALDGGNADIDVITNSLGVGFGKALAVGDFDGDKLNDLVLGAPRANPVVDSKCATRGTGGYVYVIWGQGKSVGPGALDLNDLGQAGRVFMGQAEISGKSGSTTGDGDTMRPEQDLALGVGLTDFVGDAVALLDFDGDGSDELVIGAPQAWVAGSDGLLTKDDQLVGRVYVLFGGSDWRSSNSAYKLTRLYGSDYRKGLVLEGTITGGQAGASVANAGAFRATTDSGCEDILIGAPLIGSNAGQSYLVFGSTNHYDMSQQAQGANIQWLDPVGDANHPQVPLLFSFQGIVNPVDSDNPVNTGNVGATVAVAGDINNDGATDILIGAPTSSVKDLGQLYVPIGHPWIPVGQHLNVKDLRSDNGFVLQESGAPAPVGDFNNDGYDDFVITGSDPQLVLGATTLANINGVRQFSLLQSRQVRWTGSDGYEVWIDFEGSDLDGDGVLRGRGSNPSQISGGYGNELSDWQMQVRENGDVIYTIDWATQQSVGNFNFNYDLVLSEVLASAYPNKVRGLRAGGSVVGSYTIVTSTSGGFIYLQLNEEGGYYNPSDTEWGNDKFENMGSPALHGSQLTVYRALWQGDKGYQVYIELAGSDRDGDGCLRGRGTNPDDTMEGDYSNELSAYSIRIYKIGQTGWYELLAQYLLSDQLTRGTFNLNCWLDPYQQITAAGSAKALNGLNVGFSAADGYFDLYSDGSHIRLKWPTSGQMVDQSDGGNEMFSFSSQPLLTTGPVASGDFDGDGADDFVLFTNIGAVTPAAVTSTAVADGLWAFSYTGNADPSVAVSGAVPHLIALQYLSAALSGDINGDGYDDIVLSGYAYTAKTNATYLYAYYGSPDGLDWCLRPKRSTPQQQAQTHATPSRCWI